jgi:hypothetical protein
MVTARIVATAAQNAATSDEREGAGEYTAREERARQSHDDADRRREQGFADDHPADVVGRSPERDPQADFRNTPDDAEVQHGVESYEYEKCRQDGKIDTAQTHESFAKQHGVHRVLERVALENVVAAQRDNRPPRHRFNVTGSKRGPQQYRRR